MASLEYEVKQLVVQHVQALSSNNWVSADETMTERNSKLGDNIGAPTP